MITLRRFLADFALAVGIALLINPIYVWLIQPGSYVGKDFFIMYFWSPLIGGVIFLGLAIILFTVKSKKKSAQDQNEKKDDQKEKETGQKDQVKERESSRKDENIDQTIDRILASPKVISKKVKIKEIKSSKRED